MQAARGHRDAHCASLGVDAGVLRRWVTQERGGVLDLRANRPLRSEAATEVERLQRKLRRVTTERDILKKALGYFAKEPQLSTTSLRGIVVSGPPAPCAGCWRSPTAASTNGWAERQASAVMTTPGSPVSS